LKGEQERGNGRVRGGEREAFQKKNRTKKRLAKEMATGGIRGQRGGWGWGGLERKKKRKENLLQRRPEKGRLVYHHKKNKGK